MNERTHLDIVFNPQGFTLSEIQEMVNSGQLSREEADSLFEADVAAQLIGMRPADTLPSSTQRVGSSEANQLVIWGAAHSGKTTVAGTIMALKGFKPLHAKRQEADPRTVRLQEIFRQQATLQSIPTDAEPGMVACYPIRYRAHFWCKRYPIQIVEARLGTPLSAVVERESEQVHILCIDCTQDLGWQIEQTSNLVSTLEKEGYLDHTNGIYLMVTKTDQMQAPADYQENAAQTLVTSGMPALWRKVQNICYAKEIYNAVPIAYNAGHFVLKDVALLRSKDPECVFREAILPKCQPRRNWIGRLLSKGKRWHAVVAALLAVVAVGYLASLAYETIQAPPTTPLRPFQYTTYFAQEERALRTSSYEKGCALYARLTEDLAVEKSLHTQDNAPLLSAEDYARCESMLINDFSDLLTRETDSLFQTEDWSRDENRLRKLQSQMKALMEHENLHNSNLREDVNYMDEYFDELKPLLYKSEHCESMEDVNDVIEHYEEWVRYPYENDTLVYQRLKRVPTAAYESLARSYKNRAKSQVERFFDWIGIGSGTKQYMDRMQQRFQEETSDLLESIDNLIDKLSDSKGNEEMIRELQDTRRSLTDNQAP